MVDVINVDGDVADHNAGTLHSTAGELPPAETISQVDGNETETAAVNFTYRLETQTYRLGNEIQGLREFVAQYADALSHAVATLRDTDRMTAEAAGQATALIDDVLATPASSGSSGSSNNVESATRNAFGGR